AAITEKRYASRGHLTACLVETYVIDTYVDERVQPRSQEGERRADAPGAARGPFAAWLRAWQADRGAIAGRDQLSGRLALSDALSPRAPRVDRRPLGRKG